MGQHNDHGEDAEANVDVTPDRRPSLDRACRPATIISRFIDYCLHSDYEKIYFCTKTSQKSMKKLQVKKIKCQNTFPCQLWYSGNEAKSQRSCIDSASSFAIAIDSSCNQDLTAG